MIEFNYEFIRKHLAHRYPFLLIDKVIDIDLESKSITAIKNVSNNEPYFQGHFPSFPVMPGVLIIEAFGQAGCLLASYDFEVTKQTKLGLVYFAGVDKAKFKKMVVPGDQLELHTKFIRLRAGRLYIGQCEAKVDGEVVCSAEIKAIIND